MKSDYILAFIVLFERESCIIAEGIQSLNTTLIPESTRFVIYPPLFEKETDIEINVEYFLLLTGNHRNRSIMVVVRVCAHSHQGSPGISEITRGRFFFLSHPGHPPPPLLGQKRICQEYSEKNIYGSGICSKKNIYGFGIYYKNIVYLSMPCVVSPLSTPVEPYVHALCLYRSPGG